LGPAHRYSVGRITVLTPSAPVRTAAAARISAVSRPRLLLIQRCHLQSTRRACSRHLLVCATPLSSTDLPRRGEVLFCFLSACLCSSVAVRACRHHRFPTTPSSSEPGNQAPTFPTPCRTPLELTPWTSGPRASSSPATLPLLHRPPSTAAFGAPPAPSTPPVASPEL
jgi:hypothetical protein